MFRTIFITFFIAIIAASAQPFPALDFQSDTPGTFPAGWTSKNEEGMVEVYTVAKEGENLFLHADSRGNSVTIGYDKEWNIAAYPIVRWKWRAVTMPTGTNERIKGGNDDVLGVYVVFDGWPIPNSIKYIWSETLPVGTILSSPFSGKSKMIVIRSGKEGLGEWITEEHNVLEDYRRAFKKPDETPEARGVGILTDSDNTTTRAVGDYDDIIILQAK